MRRRHGWFRYVLATTIWAFAAGCAHRTTMPVAQPTMPKTSPPSAAASSADNNDTIARNIHYWQQIEQLPPDALSAEYQRRQQAYLADRGDVDKRLRLISLLALPNTPMRNLDSALSLINQYIDNAADDDPLLNWFLYLNDSLQQQRYIERQLNTLQKSQEKLQQQLEDLKSMEKSLQERSTPTPRAP